MESCGGSGSIHIAPDKPEARVREQEITIEQESPDRYSRYQ